MWAVVILLIANTATLATFWLNRPLKRGGPPSEFLITELGFDAKQKDQYLAMVQEHRKGADEIKKRIDAARDSFFHLLNQSVNDSAKITASKNVTDLIGQLDMMTFDHFKEVRKICTPDQQKKFELLIDHIFRMMAGPPQHHGGPPGGPGGKPTGPPPGE